MRIFHLAILLPLIFLFSQCAEDCESLDCGPNATCELGECICKDGWVGEDCSLIDCINVKELRTQDSLNLVDFYNSTGGPNWTNTWNLFQPMNNWYGVQLNPCGLVTHIDLDGEVDFDNSCCDGNNLVGEINALEFLNLEFFSCGFNQLFGSLPNIDKLSNLKEFSCWDNQFSGDIPDITNLINLEFFWCTDNNFSGCIPEEACSITRVNFSKNPLLPWQGDISALCIGSTQLGASCVKDGNMGTIDENCDCSL